MKFHRIWVLENVGLLKLYYTLHCGVNMESWRWERKDHSLIMVYFSVWLTRVHLLLVWSVWWHCLRRLEALADEASVEEGHYEGGAFRIYNLAKFLNHSMLSECRCSVIVGFLLLPSFLYCLLYHEGINLSNCKPRWNPLSLNCFL